jgi:hypothetical protein
MQSRSGSRHRLRRVATGGVAAGLVLATAAASFPAGGASSPGPVARPSKIAVLTLENRSYGQVIGSHSAPYINQLARKYSLATNYYAIGHPSLPNYIALTGGSRFGITGNCAGCDTSATNLVGQLGGAGISWKAYFEGLTSNKRPGATTKTYNPHYNPFVYYDAVRGEALSRSRVVNFGSLRNDLRAHQLPRFSWIAPGVRHDGHNGSLRQADRYVSRLVPQVLRGLGPNGVLYLTWDEGAHKDRAGVNGSVGGGQVALIAAGGAARRAATSGVPANHFALLRTIEAGFGLRPLGDAGSPSTPVLSGLLQPGR